MSLESTVYNTVTEAISSPIITKYITSLTEEQTGMTSDEMIKLCESLPQKLNKFKQGEVMTALENALTKPQNIVKTEVEQIILEEIYNIVE